MEIYQASILHDQCCCFEVFQASILHPDQCCCFEVFLLTSVNLDTIWYIDVYLLLKLLSTYLPFQISSKWLVLHFVSMGKNVQKIYFVKAKQKKIMLGYSV